MLDICNDNANVGNYVQVIQGLHDSLVWWRAVGYLCAVPCEDDQASNEIIKQVYKQNNPVCSLSPLSYKTRRALLKRSKFSILTERLQSSPLQTSIGTTLSDTWGRLLFGTGNWLLTQTLHSAAHFTCQGLGWIVTWPSQHQCLR